MPAKAGHPVRAVSPADALSGRSTDVLDCPLSRAMTGMRVLSGGLAVNFQEVVHSVLAVNAELPNQAIRGEPNGHSQECPADPDRSSRNGALCCGIWGEQGRDGAEIQ